MLYLVLLYFSTTALCLWAGLIFYNLCRRVTGAPPETYQRPLICYLLSGLISITCLGQWIVLAFPLNYLVLLYGIIPLLGIFSLLLRRSLLVDLKNLWGNRIRHILFLPCCGIFLFMILALNAGPLIMDDTGSYHIQMVKWVQEYGTVPGIANLHLRFGFNSSWFLSMALLQPKIKGINSYMVLNGLISFWLSLYFLSKIFGIFPGRAGSRPVSLPGINSMYATWALFVLAMAIWPMLRGNVTSANYDFISTCCIVVLFMEASSPSTSILFTEWIVWPFYLGTVKQINFVLLLFCLWGLLRSFRQHGKRSLTVYLLTGLLIFLPFGIRNVLLSGYLLYPFPQLDIFSVDWKVSKPLVVELVNYIKYFNRSNGKTYQVVGLPLSDWIPVWQRNLVVYDRIVTDFSLLCWLLLLARWKKLKSFSPECRFFVLTMALMLVVWLLIAPDPRFIYGVLLAGLFLLPLTWPSLTSAGVCRRIVMAGLLALSVWTLCYTFRKLGTHPEYRNWLIPSALPVPQTRSLLVDGIELHIPDKVLGNWNPRCYDVPLPCLYLLNPYLRARGKGIRDGFRVDKDAIEGENKILKSF